jgi:uncharacterized protein YidB (DUF937 family)
VVQQFLDMVGEVVEGVLELVDARHIGVAEAGVVGGDDVVAVGQRRDQVAVLVRAGRCAVQQDHGGSGGRAGLAVEDSATGDLSEAMMRDHY